MTRYCFTFFHFFLFQNELRDWWTIIILWVNINKCRQLNTFLFVYACLYVIKSNVICKQKQIVTAELQFKQVWIVKTIAKCVECIGTNFKRKSWIFLCFFFWHFFSRMTRNLLRAYKPKPIAFFRSLSLKHTHFNRKQILSNHENENKFTQKSHIQFNG